MRRLLVVEDNLDVLGIMEYMIKDWEYDVATDFNSAQELLKTKNYDLVISDFNFPGGNGNDVAEIAGKIGKEVWLHTADEYSDLINTPLYNKVFKKLDRQMFDELAALKEVYDYSQPTRIVEGL